MKNIHILPTDKPSRLHYSKIKTETEITYKLVLKEELSKCNNGLLSGQRNSYITSDEEIKEGDWFITKTNDILKVQKPEKSYEPIGYKIILTTDQDLIQDGVQKIPEEFLEWFCKNSSCEEVEVDFKYENCIPVLDNNGNRILRIKIPTQSENLEEIIPKEEQCTCEVGHPYNNACCKVHGNIPKEEHKQDRTCTHNCSVVCGECQILEPKQTPLEEASERYLDSPTPHLYRLAFKEGAKWQQERSYSEEEVKVFALQAVCFIGSNWDSSNLMIKFNEWFEQFKKK